MNVEILKDAIYKANTQNRVKPEVFGYLRSVINDDISVYDSENEFIDTIIAYYKAGVLVRMSFAGEKLEICLQDLIEYLGNCKLAYNFRDNFTQFSFHSDKIGNSVKRVMFKRDNNIEFDSISNSYTETTPQGQQKIFEPQKMNFNNFILEFAT